MTEKLKQLNNIDTTNITNINITSIGLLDCFGKLILDIVLQDGVVYEFEFISPVPVDEITDWLKNNNLLDKAQLLKF